MPCKATPFTTSPPPIPAKRRNLHPGGQTPVRKLSRTTSLAHDLGSAHGAKPVQLLLLAWLLLVANVIDAIAVIAVGMFAVACDLAVVIAVLPAFSMAAASATDAEAVGVIGGIRIRLDLAAQRSILQAVALRGDHLLDAVREGTAQAINVMLFIDERLTLFEAVCEGAKVRVHAS